MNEKVEQKNSRGENDELRSVVKLLGESAILGANNASVGESDKPSGEIIDEFLNDLEDWRSSYYSDYSEMDQDSERCIDDVDFMQKLAKVSSAPEYIERIKDSIWSLVGGGEIYGEAEDWSDKRWLEEAYNEITGKILIRSFLKTSTSENGHHDNLLSETKDFLTNLGFEVPMPADTSAWSTGYPQPKQLLEAYYRQELRDNILDYNDRKIINESGLFQELPLVDIYRQNIYNTFLPRYIKDAASLTKRVTDETVDAYETLSEYLGEDALLLYLNIYASGDNEHGALEFFNEEGMLGKLGFQPDSKLIKTVMGKGARYVDYKTSGQYAKLARLNSDKMIDGPAKTLTIALGNGCFLNETGKSDLHMKDMLNVVNTTFKYHDEERVNFIAQNGEVKLEFWDRALALRDLDFIKCFENYEQHFSPEQLHFLNLPSEARDTLCEVAGMVRSYDLDKANPEKIDILNAEITKYFDAGGARPEFYEFLFSQGKLRMLLGEELADKAKTCLSPSQNHALELYAKMPTDKGEVFAGGIGNIQIHDLSNEQIDRLAELIDRASTSNAIEIRRAKGNFFTEIAKANDPKEAFEIIEQIFLRNDLPNAGKVFRVFQILYPEYIGLDGAQNRGLLGHLPDRGMISKESVIFTDLLNAELGSNNRLMAKYIKNLENGQVAAEALINEETGYDEMSSQEKVELESFLKQIISTYNSTKTGREAPFKQSENILDNLERLKQDFSVSERHNLADRIVRSFAYLLNVHNVGDLKKRIKSKVTEANKRGERFFHEQDFQIEKGDIIKSVGLMYISDILQNGAVCREFLNGETNPDCTPLDSDVTMLMESVKDNSVVKAIDWKLQHTEFIPQQVYLVLKNNGRFQENADAYDPNKLELWDNNSINYSDYGIRTGFASSEIDFIVYDEYDSDEFNEYPIGFYYQAIDPSYICFEIAKNGFYIPVVDRYSGECIFTPENYKTMRKALGGLEYYGAEEYEFADDSDLITQRSAEIFTKLNETTVDNATYEREVSAKLAEVFEQILPDFRGIKDTIDGDLNPGYVELISIGSTARGTNMLDSENDFDFIARIDASLYNNQETKHEIERQIINAFTPEDFLITPNGIRMKKTKLADSRTADVDISLVQRTNRLKYAESQSLSDRLLVMRQQDEMRETLARANIIHAKEVLSEANAYLPASSNEAKSADEKGGLGGVGIEEWILQNGGSFKIAAKTFLEAAEKANNDFNKFKHDYHVWSTGENYFSVRDNETSAEKAIDGVRDRRFTYDDFVATNMDREGFTRTVAALKQFLEEDVI